MSYRQKLTRGKQRRASRRGRARARYVAPPKRLWLGGIDMRQPILRRWYGPITSEGP